MNAKTLIPLMLSNGSIVIDLNGDVRQLLPGESPLPGEVVVIVGDESPDANGFNAQLINESGGATALDLDNEIAAIFEQLEQGVDPTLNDEFATAAGGQSGSSLTASGGIERTGAEVLAATSFDTAGLESQGCRRLKV